MFIALTLNAKLALFHEKGVLHLNHSSLDSTFSFSYYGCHSVIICISTGIIMQGMTENDVGGNMKTNSTSCVFSELVLGLLDP